jgi:Pyruvate/2-oxoacid:ferredoxin oxidoreductase gamma subunit
MQLRYAVGPFCSSRCLTALAGNDLATFPDFPAEIRAPQGTLFGVSAFQINFGSSDITTAGDAPDVLVAMNPAALKTNVKDLKPGGLIIADSGEFTKRNLEKAKYEASPLEDGSLAKWRVLAFDISPADDGQREALRPRQQGSAALQEHVDAGPGALDVRPQIANRSSRG